jgi:hypothetical protein
MLNRNDPVELNPVALEDQTIKSKHPFHKRILVEDRTNTGGKRIRTGGNLVSFAPLGPLIFNSSL